MADFTNRNFLSPNTNFTGDSSSPREHPAFAQPSADVFTVETVDVATLPDFPPGMEGLMEFLRVGVSDRNIDQGPANTHRTTTFSLFSHDLEEKGEEALFTLNQYNYASAANFLVPRAVGYSAGFLDYALRGRMTVELPEDGVFAIRDQSELLTGDDGFSKFKAIISNDTPDIEQPDGQIIPQEMSGGTLVGVARYRRNDCYEADLSGEPNPDFEIPSGCSLVEWFFSDQFVATSKEISLPDGIPREGVEVEFDFSDSPIPVNARDMVFQIVYRGTLGEEEGAIATSVMNVSEPTYVSFLNMTDLAWIDGKFYTMEEIEGDPALKERLNLDDKEPLNDVDYRADTFGSIVLDFGSNPLVTLDALPAGRFFRLAVLTTPDGAGHFANMYYSRGDGFVRSTRLFVQGWRVNTDRDPHIYYVLTETRGTHHGNVQIAYKEIGDVPVTNDDIFNLAPEYDLSPREPVPVQVNF